MHHEVVVADLYRILELDDQAQHLRRKGGDRQRQRYERALIAMLADQIPNDRHDADGDDEQLIELEAPWALLRHLADERAGHDPQEGDHEEVVAARHCHFGTHAPASCSTHPRHSWGRCRRQLLRGECAIAIAASAGRSDGLARHRDDACG